MNIHCYGVQANEQAFSSYLSSSWILKCNMMVAAFMGIKNKPLVYQSIHDCFSCPDMRMYKASVNLGVLLLFGIIKQFQCPFRRSDEDLYYMYTNLILNRWLFKGCRDCVVKCIITVQNSYMKLAAGDED